MEFARGSRISSEEGSALSFNFVNLDRLEIAGDLPASRFSIGAPIFGGSIREIEISGSVSGRRGILTELVDFETFRVLPGAVISSTAGGGSTFIALDLGVRGPRESRVEFVGQSTIVGDVLNRSFGDDVAIVAFSGDGQIDARVIEADTIEIVDGHRRLGENTCIDADRFAFRFDGGFGSLDIANDPSDFSGKRWRVDVDLPEGARMRGGVGFEAITRNGGASALGPDGRVVFEDDSDDYDFTLKPGAPSDGEGGESLDIWVWRAGQIGVIEELSYEGANQRRIGAVLDAVGEGGDPALLQLKETLATATSEDANAIVEATLPPTVDGGALSAANSVRATTGRLMGDRASRLRAQSGAAAIRGLSAFAPSEPRWFGDRAGGLAAEPASGPIAETGAIDDRRFWLQSFGSYLDQDARGGFDGYRAAGWGIAAGVDSERLIDGAILGLAFSFGHMDVEADNQNATETDIESYQLSFYGDWDLGEGWRLGGALSYAIAKNESVRSNVGGTPGLTARGDFRSHQAAITAELGRAIALDGFTFEPAASIAATRYDAESFTERGAGGAGLTAASDPVNAVEFGLGLTIGREVEREGGALGLELELGGQYELLGETLTTTSRFLGGGQAFDSNGLEPARGSLHLGLGVAWRAEAGWRAAIHYDLDHRDDQIAHSGFARIAIPF